MKKFLVFTSVTLSVLSSLVAVKVFATTDTNNNPQISETSRAATFVGGHYYSDYTVPYHSGHFPGNPLNLSNGVMYYDYSSYIGGGDYLAHYHGTLF